jgi:hypothetical protein
MGEILSALVLSCDVWSATWTDGQDITKRRLDEVSQLVGRQEFVDRGSVRRDGFVGFMFVQVLKKR